MKTCYKCQTEKQQTEFYKRRNVCKDCDKARSNIWKNNNKDRKKETSRAWYQRNKERVHNVGMAKYGITTEIYETMLKAQNNSCKICNRNESEFSKKLAVDHCHKTGKVRGLLCNPCNRLLGLARENIEVLQKAILFLEEFKK